VNGFGRLGGYPSRGAVTTRLLGRSRSNRGCGIARSSAAVAAWQRVTSCSNRMSDEFQTMHGARSGSVTSGVY
jgi:hypothetical protein